MKKRIHLLIVIGALLIGLLIGSFCDLQINQAIFSEKNGFSLFLASFGGYPAYAGLAFAAGGAYAATMKRKDLHIVMKVLSYIAATCAYLLSIYFCGKEFPSPEGINISGLEPLSYGVCAVIFAGVAVWGYFVCRKGDAKQLWPILVVLACVYVICLGTTGYLFKLIVHRPRYRYAVRLEDTAFYNWWQPFTEYKDHIGHVVNGVTLDKEEFRSFPSGHSGTSMLLAMFLPYASYFFPKLKGKETYLFYGGVLYTAMMMFSRMLAGAHYLTDVCMGALIVMVVYYVFNEFAYRKGFFDEPKNEEIPSTLENEN
ncbi:MAG: phosphatase PAP2 family protein [Bacilli bacterium]|nr:phosphatase PAP2 family protein [Bacilli bacterium]